MKERQIPRTKTYPGLFAIKISETREIVAIGLPEAEKAVRDRVAEILK